MTWDNASDQFTLVSGPTNYTINNDDILVWNPSEAGTPPTGFSPWTGYYVVNKVIVGPSTKFQLSATVGGSPLTLSDSSAVSNGVFVQITLAHNPATGALDNQSASGYQANLTAVSQWVNAIGGTVDASYLAAMATRLATFPSITAQFNADPKYAMRPTYF